MDRSRRFHTMILRSHVKKQSDYETTTPLTKKHSPPEAETYVRQSKRKKSYACENVAHTEKEGSFVLYCFIKTHTLKWKYLILPHLSTKCSG